MGHEGYALTALSDSQDLSSTRDQQTDEKGTARAADSCDNLGTGEHVILQGDEVWHDNQVYQVPCLTKAVSCIRKRYLPDLLFTNAMVLVGTRGRHPQDNEIDQEDDAWVVMWHTHSRPLCVREQPVSISQFYDRSFKAAGERPQAAQKV